MRFIISAYSLTILPSVAVALCDVEPMVKLGKTQLHGVLSPLANGVELFAGIPYAEPPLVKLRFLPTTVKVALDTPQFIATQFGPGCLQNAAMTPISEDCLTITVFRPSTVNSDDRLPVMFFIHGGARISGASSLYDGSALVARSIERGTPTIYASINYRVGPFGFPQGQEAVSKGALNIGLKDQLLGMQWVQRKTHAFGGDAAKVTVFGESAGAHSVDIHILGSNLKVIARGAIIQSSYRDPQFDSLHWAPAWETLVASVPQCAGQTNTTHTFACLQRVANTSTSRYTGTCASTPLSTGLGGLMEGLPSTVTPQSPLPVMIGSNKDEGTLFVPQDTNSSAVIRDYIIVPATPSPRGPAALAAAADRILQLYPDDPSLGSPFGTGNETFGLGSQYKRYAAVRASFSAGIHRIFGLFIQRSAFNQKGVKVKIQRPNSSFTVSFGHATFKMVDRGSFAPNDSN
ncbi:Alpha/Beta hydrolase protein [Mycena galericulata]|nr:Alpha/Beta hydrolase protein [Mycena galericulata]